MQIGNIFHSNVFLQTDRIFDMGVVENSSAGLTRRQTVEMSFTCRGAPL